MQQATAPSSFEQLEPRVLFASQTDMVVRWNEITIDVLRADTTKPGPGWSSRAMAMMSLAVFDAVNTLDGSYRPYLSNPHGYKESNTSMDAAVASAAHGVLVSLYPQQRSMLDAQLTASLADVPDGPKETRGVALGRFTADAILRDRGHDGSDRVIDYQVNPAPGHWQPDPVNPNQIAWGPGWGKVEPFVLRHDDQFQAPAPPALNSAEYATSYNEVKSLGEKNSTTRTAEQTQIGIFWGYDRGGMGTPPALYCQATVVVCKLQHNDIVENARLFALSNAAMADAGFASWNSKFTYDLWRPITAIRRGNEDGNAATDQDATWEPLGAPGNGTTIPNFTPPFPAYVSGHATFGAAAFKVLADFYGTDNMHFTLSSDELPGVTRSFDSFSQAAHENGRSRIYLGIHWNFDDIQGEAMGRSIGDWAIGHALQPRHGHHANDVADSSNLTISAAPQRIASSLFSATTIDKSDAALDLLV
jgi:hypothetical protein